MLKPLKSRDVSQQEFLKMSSAAKSFSVSRSVGIFAADVLALLLAFLTAKIFNDLAFSFGWTNYTAPLLGEETFSRLAIFTFLGAAVLFSFYNKGHYEQRIPWWSQVRYVVEALLLAMVVDAFMHFALHHPIGRLQVALTWVCSGAYLLLGRQISRYLLIQAGHWNLPTVILGDAQSITDALYAINNDRYAGYEVTAILLRDRDFDRFDRSTLPAKYQSLPLIDARGEYYENYMADHPHAFYIIALDSIRGEQRDSLLSTLSTRRLKHAIIPPIRRMSMYGMDPHFFFGHDVMLLRPRSRIQTPFGMTLKRSMDILVSGLAILATSPLFFYLYFQIKKDGGPVFFGQKRVGRDGKLFTCWKYRTMVVDAEEKLKSILATDPDAAREWEIYGKLKEDPRIIPSVGHFIRRTSIDELPQLLNVLKGEMSLVGPRPMLPEQQAQYGDDLHNYTSVKPGITGLWQVSGRNEVSFEQRVYLDSWYVRNWSVWHDIVILFKTVRTLVKREGAY
jgi:undecaprenyl-phosphate galactose phosphotransferase